jgi:preprotein translocase subunit YajC
VNILAASNNGTNIAPLLLSALVIGLLFFFMIVRPQKRRMAQQQAMINSLNPGDEVITTGGLYGTIISVEDDAAIVKIADNTEVKIATRALAMKKVEPTGENDDQ